MIEEEIIEVRCGDLYLKFADEAGANALLFVTEPATKPVLVTDPTLESVLDQLPLADAESDQTVQHEGKIYVADAGKWYELVPFMKPVQQIYPGSVDVIGPIEGVEGWHVNTRGPVFDALRPFAVVPTKPRRVWA